MQQLAAFEQRWKNLAPSAQAPMHEQVDYRLLGSALARARWELAIRTELEAKSAILRGPDAGLRLYSAVPATAVFRSAAAGDCRPDEADSGDDPGSEVNLTDMRQPFVQLAIDALDQVPNERNG